jgi:hypothetical protein
MGETGDDLVLDAANNLIHDRFREVRRLTGLLFPGLPSKVHDLLDKPTGRPHPFLLLATISIPAFSRGSPHKRLNPRSSFLFGLDRLLPDEALQVLQNFLSDFEFALDSFPS